MADYATLLRDHVTLKCRSLDRIFLPAYVPKLQSVGQVCIFLRWQRKFKIPSSAAFGKIGDEYVKAIHKFAETHKIPVVHFEKGQNKEELARPYLEAAAREGLVRTRSTASSGAGFAACLRHSPRPTSEPVTFTSWRSASSRFPTAVCLIDRKRVGCGSKV